MAQWEQMSFCSVPQNQSSSDSCSTHTSPSPEKIPDSVSVVVVVAPPGEVDASVSAPASPCPFNTEKIGCSPSIPEGFWKELPSVAEGEDGHVRSHVVSSSVMAQ